MEVVKIQVSVISKQLKLLNYSRKARANYVVVKFACVCSSDSID